GAGGGGAVEADHDAIERLAAQHLITQAYLEVGELGPGVELRPGDVGVELGGFALVAVVVERADVGGLAVVAADVGARGDGAGDAEADLLALLLVDADHVDQAEKGGAFLQLGFQRLLHARSEERRVGRRTINWQTTSTLM